MNVLVTGSAGFIGSHLCEALVSKKVNVIGIDNFDPFYSQQIKNTNIQLLKESPYFTFYELNINFRESLEQIIDDFDVIVHLAAKAGVRPSIMNPVEYITTNILGTQNLVDFMIKRGKKKLVFASSSSVYGNSSKKEFFESEVTDKPISPYAFTKKSCELLLHNYYSLNMIDVVLLRFFTVYGPRQRPDLAIHKFVDSILNNNPISVYGDGSTSRDYTYVSDTVNGIINAIDYVFNTEKVCEVFNLGNNKPIALIDLIKSIENVIQKKAILSFTEKQQGDVDSTCANIDKAQHILNYEPTVSLQTGLELFYRWKLNQLKHA